MSLPICDVCAKTGILCNVCEKKLSDGVVSPLDVELSKILYELGGGEIEFTKAIETSDHVIILAPKESLGKIIGRSGATIRVISRKIGKQVRVVGSGELKEMIYDLTSPAKVLGVNKVFKPDGSVSQRIRISKKDKSKLRLNPEDIEKLTSSLSKDKVEIVFE
jgi:transcription antitermination factor NusA-like protein